MAALDLARFTFNGDTLHSVSELAFDEVIKGPDLNMIHTIYSNIVTYAQLGFVGKGGLVGVKNQGCDPTPQAWTVGTRDLKFDPQAWEILIALCYTDLESTAAVYSMRKGIDMSNFEDTDYMAILLEVLLSSMNEFVYRLIWFEDKDAKNVADGGTVTDGVDTDYFTIIDGLFKQMRMQSADNPKQRVTIAENAGATYDAQSVTSDAAVSYIKTMYRQAPIQLRNLKDKFFLTTQGIWDAYAESLQSARYLETTYLNLVNGMQTVSYNGVPIIAMPIWDEIITSYFDNGTKFDNPNRIVLSAKSVLAFGVDDPNAFENVESWYEKKDRKVYLQSMGKADAKLANPALFVLGI